MEPTAPVPPPPAHPERGWLRDLAVDVTPLRTSRDFRLLFGGRAVSFAGTMITFVAVPFQVFRLTHSSLAVGLLGIAELVPMLALAFVGGALADARDRRRMVQLTELGLAAASVALCLNALAPSPQLWIVYLAAAAMSGLDALQRPSLDAMIPRLVAKADVGAAAALSALIMTVGMVLGPALAGVLITTTTLWFAYLVDVVTFAGSLLALRAMRAMRPPEGAEPPSIRRIAEGLRYARGRQELLGSYLVDINAMFFGMPMALFPALAATRFGGPGVLGLLYAAPAAGAFVVSATSGWSSRVRRHGLAILLSAAVWGLAIIGFGLTHSRLAALAFLAAAGAGDMCSGIFRSTLWNQTIPDQLRGRLAGIELISYSSGPALGNVEAGTVAAMTTPATSVVAGGVLCIVGTLAFAVFLPRFRHYEGPAVITAE
jgi:MFS family permease